MTRTKKYLWMVLTVLVLTVLAGTAAFAKDPRPTAITKVTSATKTVKVGAKFELKVRTTPVNAEDDYLEWSIVEGSGVICFENTDRTGDDADFVALKTGDAKVRCSIKGKGEEYAETFTVKVTEKGSSAGASGAGLTRVGKKTKTVEVGDDIDLKVKVTGTLRKKYLKWTIRDTDILKFDDGNHGKKVEVKGRKAGTTTVTCKNLKTKKTITYTIKVVADDD